MIIKRFIAENFRNIDKCDIIFSNGVNLLYGDNAQGKTNAIEGIYIFARGKSFRASEDKELVKFEKEGFRLFIEYEDKKGENSLEYSFFRTVFYKSEVIGIKQNGFEISYHFFYFF